MVTFRKHKLACIQELQAMPDHHPEDPFYARAAAELQEIEETIQTERERDFEYPSLRKTARNVNLDLTQSTDANLISPDKFSLPNNEENLGFDSQLENTQNEPKSPLATRPATPTNKSTAQNTSPLPPPVMLKITDT
ncbi:hypothetical protein TNCT_701121, partial [Trichonephila clavata]